MTRKLGKARALAASLVLAGAAIFNTAASAQWDSPNCWYEVEDQCATEWQNWGYRTLADCERLEPCYVCLYGYLCGYDDRWDYTSVNIDAVKPW